MLFHYFHHFDEKNVQTHLAGKIRENNENNAVLCYFTIFNILTRKTSKMSKLFTKFVTLYFSLIYFASTNQLIITFCRGNGLLRFRTSRFRLFLNFHTQSGSLLLMDQFNSTMLELSSVTTGVSKCHQRTVQRDHSFY
mgnify:CR=1 FL=1